MLTTQTEGFLGLFLPYEYIEAEEASRYKPLNR